MMSLFDFFRSNKDLKTFFEVFKSRLPVGSSASIILGLFIMALAIATL